MAPLSIVIKAGTCVVSADNTRCSGVVHYVDA